MKKITSIIMLFLVVSQLARTVSCPEDGKFEHNMYTCFTVDDELYSFAGFIALTHIPVNVYMRKLGDMHNGSPMYKVEEVQIDCEKLK